MLLRASAFCGITLIDLGPPGSSFKTPLDLLVSLIPIFLLIYCLLILDSAASGRLWYGQVPSCFKMAPPPPGGISPHSRRRQPPSKAKVVCGMCATCVCAVVRVWKGGVGRAQLDSSAARPRQPTSALGRGPSSTEPCGRFHCSWAQFSKTSCFEKHSFCD